MPFTVLPCTVVRHTVRPISISNFACNSFRVTLGFSLIRCSKKFLRSSVIFALRAPPRVLVSTNSPASSPASSRACSRHGSHVKPHGTLWRIEMIRCIFSDCHLHELCLIRNCALTPYPNDRSIANLISYKPHWFYDLHFSF